MQEEFDAATSGRLATSEGAVIRDYRCKHTVTAARWFDTEENRRWFSYWFGAYDVQFEMRGSVIVLPDECGEATEGEWVMYWDGEFLILDDAAFKETYEELKQPSP